jgi:DNA-binding response OmpR family regulator
MLAAELKASGRAVFVCADATAAGAFLRATPDRFELLIVDRNDRLHDRDLAQAVRTLAPSLDVLALDEPDRAVDAAWPRLRRITKPFGVHELRRALAPSSASR